MDAEFFDGLVKASLGIQGAMMDEGFVSPPCLWVFRDGKPIAQVVLRQVAVGEDAEDGILQMGHLGWAAAADEVVAVWESQDVGRATDRTPDFPNPCLNLLWTDGVGRRLHRFPYDVFGEVEAATGNLVQVGWQWKEPLPPQTDPLPPPSVTAMLQQCFTPLELPGDEDPFDVTDNYLRSEGYRVNLVKQP
jgi:hypothetical protein